MNPVEEVTFLKCDAGESVIRVIFLHHCEFQVFMITDSAGLTCIDNIV